MITSLFPCDMGSEDYRVCRMVEIRRPSILYLPSKRSSLVAHRSERW
jgi:hypothetical protein